MTVRQIKKSISCCGLLCCFCKADGSCSCRSDDHCGERLSPEGCFHYDCCKDRGLKGCWECSKFCCDKGVFKDNLRIRTFVKCIKEDGIDNFAKYILRNHKDGVVYHKHSLTGDYDLPTEDAILKLLRDGVVKGG